MGSKLAAKINQKSTKDQAQDGLPLSIDFWWILMDFCRQVGVQNRAKSDKKSIGKCIEKMIKKICVLEAPGGGNPRARLGCAGILGPPITNSQRQPHTTAHRPQATGLKNT